MKPYIKYVERYEKCQDAITRSGCDALKISFHNMLLVTSPYVECHVRNPLAELYQCNIILFTDSSNVLLIIHHSREKVDGHTPKQDQKNKDKSYATLCLRNQGQEK